MLRVKLPPVSSFFIPGSVRLAVCCSWRFSFGVLCQLHLVGPILFNEPCRRSNANISSARGWIFSALLRCIADTTSGQ